MINLKFTSRFFEEHIGLKVNTLHYYVQAGAVTPDIDAGEGRGKSREFSDTNFVEIVLIKNLMDHGYPKKAILSVMRGINKAKERDRLNPRREHRGKVEYLLIFKDGKDFRHRFVIDGGPEMSRRELKAAIKKTSTNDAENLADFLSMIPFCFCINLTTVFNAVLLDFISQHT